MRQVVGETTGLEGLDCSINMAAARQKSLQLLTVPCVASLIITIITYLRDSQLYGYGGSRTVIETIVITGAY